MSVCIVFAEDPEFDYFKVDLVCVDEEWAILHVENLHTKGIVSYYEIHDVLDEPTGG